MATLATAGIEDGNVVLRPETGKSILIEGNLVDKVNIKTHVGYANSELRTESKAITTSDATATNIFTRAVPVSSTLGVWVKVIGKKDGANADGIISQKFQAVTNNAGTVAVVGTTGGSDIESATGTPAVTIVANNTTDEIEVKVAGIAAETWYWVAHVESCVLTTSA